MPSSDISLPTHIEIEPTETCNLRCRMCHVSYMPVENRPRLAAELIDKLEDLRDAYVIIGSGFEPMMNKEFSSIIRKLTRLNSSIELITNGTLLSDENVEALKDCDLKSMTFSFDGIQEDTYEWIRRGASHATTIDSILRFRRDFAGRDTFFAVNSTMMRANMEEVSAIVAFWDLHDFDMVRLISMVVREPDPELFKQSLYPVRERYYELLDDAARDIIENKRRIVARSPHYNDSPVRDQYPDHFIEDHVVSGHPSARIARMIRQEQQYGAGPGMTFPCRSPFTFARILFNGDVQLCSTYSIGNLTKDSFHDIWFGEKARKVREMVIKDQRICDACDYFRFCVNSQKVDLENPENYFAKHLIELAGQVDFEAGLSNLEASKRPPRLIDRLNGKAIVEYDKNYFIIPASLGPVDLLTIDGKALPGITVVSGLREARKLAAESSSGE
jgi:radical SAM protein with 4Fe4S-binding SPASM domain